MPYGENYCQLQLLFVLIVTDLPLLQGLFSVDASPALSVGLGADVVHFHTPSGLRVSFPEPCPNPDKLWIPARVWNRNAILSSTYAACGIAWSGLTMSPNSFFGSYSEFFVSSVTDFGLSGMLARTAGYQS